MSSSPSLDTLIEALQCLPGVGQKSAQRMALYLIERDQQGARKIAGSLTEALDKVSHCQKCRNFSDGDVCQICSNSGRDDSLICIVESPADVLAIESSGAYRGLYFVLLGRLSPLDGLGPEQLGLEFLEKYRGWGGEALILVMTAYGGLDLAMEAMKKGAYDYIPKPFGADDVLLIVRKAEEREQLRAEVGRLRREVRADARFGEIVVGSPAMRGASELVQRVAPHDSPVLITGSSGTGKELIARMLHRESSRAQGAFVPVNCGGVPEQLLESEFFGFVRGAFTGADRDKEGLFEAADGGTLFLDEVGELDLAVQAKVLRVLEGQGFDRVGGGTPVEADVRVVAATNRPLQAMVEEATVIPAANRRE